MRKIRWGVLGTAYIFERDTGLGMQLAENCELYAVAGRSLEKAEAFRDKYGFKIAYGDYASLLEDPMVEAVYIPLPNTLHYEWTIRALNSGKHVLCEKPLAPTEEQAREMFAAAKKNGVYLMEAFAYQHSPFISAVKQELDSGSIGDVLYIESALIYSDYVMSNIRMRRETLGGSMYDLGVYCASMIQRMLGEEPAKVMAAAEMNEENIDMFTSVIFKYADGKRAHFDCGMVLATEKNVALNRFQIHGTTGVIRSGVFGFNRHGELSYTVESHTGETRTETVSVPHNYMLEVEQLGRCVAGEATPAVTEEFSIMNARTTDRVLKAIGYTE